MLSKTRISDYALVHLEISQFAQENKSIREDKVLIKVLDNCCDLVGVFCGYNNTNILKCVNTKV